VRLSYTDATQKREIIIARFSAAHRIFLPPKKVIKEMPILAERRSVDDCALSFYLHAMGLTNKDDSTGKLKLKLSLCF
jgi:hypothetical protein